MEKKYKLTEESINYLCRTLYRIEALKDFGDVKKGDKGGYVESENNLSQEGDCWIYNNAKVYDNAKVWVNAKIYNSAKIFDSAKVWGKVEVSGNAKVFGDALVMGRAKVYGNIQVCGNAKVWGRTKVYGNVQVYGDAKIGHKAKVYGNAKVCGNAEVKKKSDYIVFKNWWSSGRYFTWTRSNNMWAVGGFYGTGEELIAKAYEDSELSGKEYKRVVDYVESILQDNK